MVIGNMSSRDGGIVGARSRRRGWLATADSPKSCPSYCWLNIPEWSDPVYRQSSDLGIPTMV